MIDAVVSMAAGLIAGIFIGLGARIAMGAIAFANSDASRFTLSGTVAVVATFASFGIGLGLIYEILLRSLLKHSGLFFGILLTICSWYPLAEAGVQTLNFQPTAISLVFFSGVFVALIWIPFGLILEEILSRWHNRESYFAAK